MSVLVILEVQAKPENVSEVKSYMAGAAVGIRAEDGCQDIYAYANTEDPGNMIFVEHWDSRAHYEKHLARAMESESANKAVAMLTGPPSIRYFERIDE